MAITIRDIFTNIFLHSDIQTIQSLIFVCKQLHHYYDNYLLTSKLLHDHMEVLPFNTFLEWSKIYHDGMIRKLKIYSNDYCNSLIKQAKNILKTAEIESIIHKKQYNVHVRIPTGQSQLIYQLLEINMKNKCNTITFHVDTNIISFGMIKYTNFERDIQRTVPIFSIKVSYQALIHYLTVILYEGHYEKIIDHQKETYQMKHGYHDRRYGIIRTLEIIDI